MFTQLKWVGTRHIVFVLVTMLVAGNVLAQETPVAVSGRPSEPNGLILQRILVKVNGDIILE